MDLTTQRLLQVAAGAAGGPSVYVEDVFSTFLYRGNASTQTITNGIDLSGEGGMVWIKSRAQGWNHLLSDTERGTSSQLYSDLDYSAGGATNAVTAFNTDGFDLGANSSINTNTSNHVSWTFRKAPGFFDVVTYTGNGTAGRTIAHNLGSAPGMIWVKGISHTSNWQVYHRSQGATEYLELNTNNPAVDSTSRWNDTEPTATEFTLGDDNTVNGSSNTYVAYLFAHDDARFGPNADESIVKCDTYTGNGDSVGPIIDLGFKPQFVLIKRADTAADWCVFDRERGASMVESYGAFLVPNDTNVETIGDYVNFTDTGFQLVSSNAILNNNSGSYIYMAIRDEQVDPTDGTDVLYLNARAGTGSDTTQDLGFYGSTIWTKRRDVGGSSWVVNSRSLGKSSWHFDDGAVANNDDRVSFLQAQTDQLSIDAHAEVNNSSSNYIDYVFKRAKGAFTEFSYIGTGNSTSIPHSLEAVPQLWFIKRLTTNSNNCTVGSMLLGLNEYLETKKTDSPITNSNRWGGSRPTSTGLAVGSHNSTNGDGNHYHAMLFGNVSGVVDIGTYTGTGVAGLQVDCGFTAGARFVLIKRIDTANAWKVFDTARGITSTTSPSLELQQNAVEATTDLLDPYSLGFTIDTDTGALNDLNGTYLYLAIA